MTTWPNHQQLKTENQVMKEKQQGSTKRWMTTGSGEKQAIEVASESAPSKLNKDGKVEDNVKSKGYEDENDTWEEVTMN